MCGLTACQFASARTDLLYRCEADGGCPRELVCSTRAETAGFCVPLDGGTADGGPLDGGAADGGAADAGQLDGGPIDAGKLDGGGPVVVFDLIFDNSDGGSLDGFPVLVAIDRDLLSVSDPSSELRFFDPDTQADLPFQIDSWNPTGESTIWVRVPNLAPGTADRITLFAGPGAGGHEDATGKSVFGAYAGVWHLGPSALTDSSGSGHDAVAIGASPDAGHIGGALRFLPPGDQHVEFDGGQVLFDGWAAFSLELWLRADYAMLMGSMPEGGVLNKGGGINLGRVFATGGPGSRSLLFQTDMHFASTESCFLNADLPLRTWTWFVYTFDGHSVVMYADGVEVNRFTSTHASTALVSDQGQFILGSPGSPINGSIDEVRISRTALSPKWLLAQHRSMTRRLISFVRR